MPRANGPMKRAHAQKSPRQNTRQSSDNVLSVQPPIPPHSIISNSSQCHFPKLPPFSFTSQVPSPGIRSSWSERALPPRYIHCISACSSLSGADPLRRTGEPWAPVPVRGHRPFSCLSREQNQAKCILPGGVFLPAGRPCLVEPEAVQADGNKVCESLQGQGHRGCAPASRLLSFWITEIGQLALLPHGLGPFHDPIASMSFVSSFCHSVSLILVLYLLQLCPNHPPVFDHQLGKAHFFNDMLVLKFPGNSVPLSPSPPSGATTRTYSPSHLVLVLEGTYDMDGRMPPTARNAPR